MTLPRARLLLLGLVGCGTPPLPAPIATGTAAPIGASPPSPPAVVARVAEDAPREPVSGVMLVYEDARFYTWNDRKTPRLAPEAFDRAGAPARVIAVKAVARRGDWYEIVLGQAPGGACLGASSFVRGHDLELVVHRRDVARVVVSPFVRSYDDGTSIALAPGVLAVPAAHPGEPMVFESRDLSITLHGDSPELGEVFVPAERSRPSGSGKYLDVRKRDELRFGPGGGGGSALVVSRRPGGGTDLEIVSVGTTLGHRTRVRVDDACASLSASVDPSAIKTTGSGWGTGVGCGRLRGSVDVPEGTPVFFPDGERAGTTTARRDIVVRNADWGKNACYLVGIDPVCPDSGPTIELCAPRESLVAPPGKPR